MIEPKRYQRQSIDLKLFQDFFIECGDYKMNNLDKTASPIWTKCYENHDENVWIFNLFNAFAQQRVNILYALS